MEKHFQISKKPVVPVGVALREGVLPILGIIGITAVLVGFFAIFLHLGHNMAPVIEPHYDDGELVDPNPMRLLFLVLAFVAAFVCAVFADRSHSHGKLMRAFWTAYAGGTMLWQSVGECAWHFSIPSEDFIMCFPHIEGASALFLVIITTLLLAYCYRRHAFSWAVWIFVLSFVGNWFGHFVQIGTYPLVSAATEELTWFATIGSILGILGILASLWINFWVAQTRKARLCCCLMLYFSIGLIVTGVAGI